MADFFGYGVISKVLSFSGFVQSAQLKLKRYCLSLTLVFSQLSSLLVRLYWCLTFPHSSFSSQSVSASRIWFGRHLYSVGLFESYFSESGWFLILHLIGRTDHTFSFLLVHSKLQRHFLVSGPLLVVHFGFMPLILSNLPPKLSHSTVSSRNIMFFWATATAAREAIEKTWMIFFKFKLYFLKFCLLPSWFDWMMIWSWLACRF